MTSFEIGALVVAIVAFILLIICIVLLVMMKKRKKEHIGHKEDRRKENKRQRNVRRIMNLDEEQRADEPDPEFGDASETEERKKAESKGRKKHHMETASRDALGTNGEPRLDGARVSHRRDHPERIKQDEMWKQRQQEVSELVQRQQEYERKNRLRLVYSPCTGEVLYFAENEEEAAKNGLSNPGLIISPSDDKVYAPVNGKILEIEMEKSRIYMQSDRGLDIMMQIEMEGEDETADYWTTRVQPGSQIRVGDLIIRLNQSLIKSHQSEFALSVMVQNYDKRQLLLMRKMNYVSHGDKIITLKEDPSL
ncbi:MAG: hypothetical protein E7256_17155 [Lachnospiraceae bacterium]|nr:hypothetical protein [Lachnospiraceae bacterium]